ncbi:Icc-related predicted phosphoesterase [Pontibacter mucosus]|uniref:Icc-related predicted phosphoesterase n=1 Tax=Pontibacter mucosus TaxID=1649266 RepID=A0A2T5YQ10_9BACT|nr:metallophosphoesterase [Pontibacter mucosus]PTX21408.1 Icc-related predicted phosphoesterase [Pontibacter mucosus]
MATKKEKKTRIAAVGDIHVRETDRGKWEEFFRKASEEADVLLLCGDLTDTGRTAEAEVLAQEMKVCTIPVVAVLGNHDYERDNQKSIRKALLRDNVYILDGDSIVIGDVGFAGVKGFGGGFDRGMLGMFGEPMIKSFVQEAVDEALKLDGALARLENDHVDIKKIAVLHYAPIKATVVGEPEQIFPFLGSSRLAEPINRRGVIAAFHGHAHIGTLEGETSKGVKVFNVSRPILQQEGYDPTYYIFEV